MYISNTVTALHTSQIAYPIGPDKDSYTLLSYFTEVVETGEISVKHEVYKNYHSDKKRTLMFRDTSKECIKFIKDLVDHVESTQGTWKRDDRLNEVWMPIVFA